MSDRSGLRGPDRSENKKPDVGDAVTVARSAKRPGVLFTTANSSLYLMLFDLYVHADGWLQRLDPRTKIALVLCGAVLFVVINSVTMLLGLLAAIHVILLTSKVPVRQIGWVWRQLLRVIVIIVLVFPLFSRLPGPVLFTLGPLTVTWTGVLAGVATATRVVGMSLLFFVILFTTRQNDLVRGLVRLGLPFEWGSPCRLRCGTFPASATPLARSRRRKPRAAGRWSAATS